jgi:hypothetical protein
MKEGKWDKMKEEDRLRNKLSMMKSIRRRKR